MHPDDSTPVVNKCYDNYSPKHLLPVQKALQVFPRNIHVIMDHDHRSDARAKVLSFKSMKSAPTYDVHEKNCEWN